VRAIEVRAAGDPEVMQLQERAEPQPAADEVRIRAHAIGVSYVDAFRRSGRGRAPLPLPWTPGSEVAGEIEAVGADVERFAVGDRVVTASARAAYAELAVARAEQTLALPAGMDDETAAAALAHGMTAHALAMDAAPLSRGDAALVHAAGGGIGLLLVQLLVGRGVRVIGTASSEAKERAAIEAGAEAVLRYTDPAVDVAAEVRRIIGGGVAAAFDSVGAPTNAASMDALDVLGTLVIYGQAGGPPPPIDPQALAPRGLGVRRFGFAHYARTRAELERHAKAVLGGVRDGTLAPRIADRLPLAEAAEAHRRLEARSVVGKLLLLP
jgi:NADPH2:quinone reductase